MAEQIHGLKMGDGKITVAVSSSGCTKAADFRLEVAEAGGELTLLLVRTQPDFCKMMPSVTEIDFALPDQLRTVPFRVQNPFIKGPVWPPSE